MFVGAEPSPVGITAWSQPWVPMWLEWEAELELTDTLRGWKLDAVDLEPDVDVSVTPTTTTMAGRSLLTTGAARTMAAAVRDFLAAEDALEKATGGVGDVPDDVEKALAALAGAVENLDVVTATLDGIRLRLLGVDARDGFQRTAPPTARSSRRSRSGRPSSSPRARCTSRRRVCLTRSGGRSTSPWWSRPPSRSATSFPTGRARCACGRGSRGRHAGCSGSSTRAADTEPVEARIDQVDPDGHGQSGRRLRAPGPPRRVARVFDGLRHPVGELFHEPIGGARGLGDRARPAGSARRRPAVRPRAGQVPLGWFATGLVAADVKDRNSPAPSRMPKRALSAVLRAIDTTLWTVDTFAGLGSEHVAGLVGRPIAVVRAHLWLELQPEDLLDLSDPSRRRSATAAEAALAAEAFPVRLGELTRDRRRRCSGSSSTTTSSTCISSTAWSRRWPSRSGPMAISRKGRRRSSIATW